MSFFFLDTFLKLFLLGNYLGYKSRFSCFKNLTSPSMVLFLGPTHLKSPILYMLVNIWCY